MADSVKHACVITPIYPDKWFFEQGAFVDRLVHEWKNQGLRVDVVAPRKISNTLKRVFTDKYTSHQIAGDTVLYPKYISVSNKKLLNLDLKKISLQNFNKSALNSLESLNTPDFFYGQFLESGGSAVVAAGKKYFRPAFANVGESALNKSGSDEEKIKLSELIRSLDGLACVSKELADEVIRLGADPERVMFYPNTVNLDRFKKLNQSKCRKKVGLPSDDIIAIFVGHFIERKGPLRVLQSLEMQSNKKVKAIFIGRGDQQPRSELILHKGPLPNNELNTWLCASDFFVLPTLQEGYCNAINEAMACGLPIISSDIPEIRMQVPAEAGILVNPSDTNLLARAIDELACNPDIRKKMGEAAYREQVKRSSRSRASVILEWINQILKQQKDQ